MLGRLVVLCLQGDELGTGRNPWEAGVRAENQYQAQEGSAKHLNTPLVVQRLATGEAGQVGQGGGIRGNGSWFSPRLAAGGVGRAVTLFGLGTSGPGECTFWPSRCCSGRRNDGSRGSGGGGKKGNCLEPTQCREHSLGPRPPEPQIQTFCEYFIKTKLFWINRGLQFLPLWVFCGHHFLCSPWGD